MIDEADHAADDGRRVPVGVIASRRHFAGLRSLWYPVLCCLHRFFIAIARVAVNEDESGGTAIDPCVWSAGSVPKRKEVKEGVDFAFLPGPPSLWDEEWTRADFSSVRGECFGMAVLC